jgi:hypothetical protein
MYQERIEEKVAQLNRLRAQKEQLEADLRTTQHGIHQTEGMILVLQELLREKKKEEGAE